MTQVQQRVGTSVAYICGGTPRDRYLKHLENISDVDITTGDKTVQYLAQELGSELSEKYNVTVRSHDDGHASIYIGSFKMDFSSNYNAPNIDQLLAQKGIAKPTEMQKEMYSRDFTCNALLLSLDLKQLVDPTKRGFPDIKEKKIRTCLAPEITLVSNKNRVIRAIYLASKLDFDIDDSIVEFVQKNPASVKIASEKVLTEKLNEAFTRDADKASYYLTKMGIWDQIPITEVVQPYYMKRSNMTSKKAYYQGGGGVNEPTPGKKKYKSDPALVNQPRFKEPFYKNYDLYRVPGMEHIGPGVGWHSMQDYKSVSEFLEEKRERMRPRYVSDDSWILDSGEITKKNPNGVKARASLLSRILKSAGPNTCGFCGQQKLDVTFPCEHCGKGGAKVGDDNDGPNYDYGSGLYMNLDKYDSVDDFRKHKPEGQGAFYHADDNDIDFPIDENIEPNLVAPTESTEDNENPVGRANQMGGYLDEYLPEDDKEGKSPDKLDFGRDYVEDEKAAPLNHENIEKLLSKYSPHGQFGLPDGVDLPDEDLTESSSKNPDYGTRGPESLIYEDKWNV